VFLDNAEEVPTTPDRARCFLTRSEAAERLRIGVALLDRMIDSGELRALHLHRRVIIPSSSLEELGREEKLR
jgi:excisionase family DNA binding protein